MPKGRTLSNFAIFCLLLLLPAARAEAQWLSLSFERITIEDGLPNPSVLDIIQDRQGFMWFATLNGIVRYDGYRMTVYHPAAVERDSLPERDVPTLYEDREGHIWLGLANQKVKLFYYDPHIDLFQPFPLPEKHPDFYNRPIRTFLQDRKGQLWVGTLGNGLFRLDISKWQPGKPTSEIPIEHFAQEHYHPSDEINGTLFEDDDGFIWMPTDDGLYRLDPETGERKGFTFEEKAGAFDLLFDAPNTLWVATGKGLVGFDLETHNDMCYKHDPALPNSLGAEWVINIRKDREGRLWLETGAGIDIFDLQKKLFYHVRNVEDGLGTNYGGRLFVDYSGNIWAATWQSGIYKFNPDKGRFHFLRPDFYRKIKHGEHPINATLEDKKGNLWLGTEGDGLVRWDRKNDAYHNFRHQPGNSNSLSSNKIWSIAEDADGYLWIGTAAGLDRLNPADGSVRRYQPYPGEGAIVWQSK